jgi:AcrR family transcriptional regulator
MRYQKGHKKQTRQRIVEIASQRFRKEGVASVGLASLMSDAGLTHGGFYAHFKSKEDLFREAVAAALSATTAEIERVAQQTGDGLEDIVRGYLSERHRDQPQHGCVAASLASEVARHPKRTRRTFAARIEKVVDLIEAHLPAAGPATRRRRSVAIFSLMMGALQLARAEPDKTQSKEILESAVEAALTLADIESRSVEPVRPATGSS